jgi:hypothetical protein
MSHNRCHGIQHLPQRHTGGDTAAASYSDPGLAASTVYTSAVSAYDAAGNTSAQSSSASVITRPAPKNGSRFGQSAGEGGRQQAFLRPPLEPAALGGLYRPGLQNRPFRRSHHHDVGRFEESDTKHRGCG